MRISIHNKFTRFFIIESRFRTRLYFLILAVVLLVLQYVILQIKHTQLNAAMSEKAWVMQIPQMERTVREKEEALARRIEKKRMAEEAAALEKLAATLAAPEEITPPALPELNPEPVLEGLSIRGDVTSALIDGTIYTEGDVVGESRIIKIDFNGIKLKHLSTAETKTLYFKKGENFENE